MLANLEIGLHEQTRLQPEIGEALDAAATTGDRLSGNLVRRLLGVVVQRGLTRLSRVAITRSFMVLTLPGAVLALGRNLDAPFPEALRTPTNAELETLLARFEPAAGALDDCGAEDWAQLTQRMHYIAHLFRAYHEIPALASAPFTRGTARAHPRGRRARRRALAGVPEDVVPCGDAARHVVQGLNSTTEEG